MKKNYSKTVDGIIERIPGFVAREELLFIAESLSGDLRSADIKASGTPNWAVNIGVWKGLSLAVMSVAGGNDHILGVDTFEGSPELPDPGDELMLDCLDYLVSVSARPILMARDSLYVAAIFTGDVSFLFLDASHDYESVKADLMAWIPHIVSGGILMVHDYYLPLGHPEDGFPGVSEAVNELCYGWEMLQFRAGDEWSSWVGVKP